MDLILKRSLYEDDGIFGELLDHDKNRIAYTLEHAYSISEGAFQVKLPEGTFVCQRGEHRLHHMTHDFQTFEVQNVEGHSNILFHWGNYNRDSDGCILLGSSVSKPPNGPRMLTASRAAFAKFMDIQADQLIFHLLVIG